MMRGTFGNVRIKNALVPDREGNWTEHFGSGEVMSIYDAAMMYVAEGTPLVLLSLGGGAVLVFVSVAMFAPLFSSPSASFLGLPLEHLPWSRTTGHMARENAASNNKRTASTAAGLMIGLALIAMA